jgi:hypothetical protein
MVHIVNLIGDNIIPPFVFVLVPIEDVRVVRSHSCTRNNNNIITINNTRCIGGTVTRRDDRCHSTTATTTTRHFYENICR